MKIKSIYKKVLFILVGILFLTPFLNKEIKKEKSITENIFPNLEKVYADVPIPAFEHSSDSDGGGAN